MLAPKKTWMLLASLLLAACNTPPTSIVQGPLTARPAAPPDVRPANGSIYQTATTRPLFEDRVPRYVGDTMTVVIEEKTSTQNKEETSLSRESSYNAGTPTVNLPLFPGVIEKKLGGVNVSAGASGSSEGKGEAKSTSVFTGSITVTVVEVLSNGNLIVSGEKQVRVNGEHEFIRLSGVVNPRDIKPGNMLSSTKLADARVELQNQGNNHAFAQPGWLARFFMTILPF
jgi:flagellar L-ring protein precursor FlgH